MRVLIIAPLVGVGDEVVTSCLESVRVYDMLWINDVRVDLRYDVQDMAQAFTSTGDNQSHRYCSLPTKGSPRNIWQPCSSFNYSLCGVYLACVRLNSFGKEEDNHCDVFLGSKLVLLSDAFILTVRRSRT